MCRRNKINLALRLWITRKKYKVQIELIGRIPLAIFGRWIVMGSSIASLFSRRARANGVIRAEMGREMFQLTPALARRASAASLLESLIDQRIYFGRRRRANEAWPDLQTVAAALAREIDRVKAKTPGRPVVVSPFHYVSQYANIYVIDQLQKLLGVESIAVVSGVPRHIYGNDDAQIPGIKVLYTYGDENRNGLGVRVARALRRNGIIAMFTDAPPFAMHQYPMQTVDVSMFNRNARIHNGVFRLGASHDAVLLAFYLRFDQGRFSAKLFEPIALADPDAPQKLAHRIETALIDNYPNWLLGGHPSMYAFSPAK